MKQKDEILTELLEQSGEKLHRLLFRITLNKETSEELMQDVFVKLCSIRNIETIENPQAYAMRMAMNLAFDRRRKSIQNTSLSDNLNSQIQSPENIVSNQEDFQQILNAIQQLARPIRECFVLRHIEQMDYEHIARYVQKSPQSIRAMCSKGMQQIRQILNPSDVTPSQKEVVNE